MRGRAKRPRFVAVTYASQDLQDSARKAAGRSLYLLGIDLQACTRRICASVTTISAGLAASLVTPSPVAAQHACSGSRFVPPAHRLPFESTASSTKPPTPASSRLPISSRWSRTAGSPRRRRPRSGCSSTTTTSTSRCGPGRAGRIGWSPTRCGATATTSAWATASASRSTRSTTAATPSSSRSTRSAARTDGQSTNERQYNSRLEPGLGSRGRTVRRRLDGRSRDPVQVAPLPAGQRAGLGLQRAPQQQMEERDLVSRTHSAGVRHRPRQLRRVAVRDRWSASTRRPGRRTSRSSRTRSPI